MAPTAKGPQATVVDAKLKSETITRRGTPAPNPPKPPFVLPAAARETIKGPSSAVSRFGSDTRELAVSHIKAKAKALGGLPGGATGDVVAAGSGYMQSFEGCDIYYSSSTGAHEVHGDIRVKYNDLGGASGELGLPTTDETGTPDGIGRYNHFVGGSIYWTPHTGPMMVRGRIRDVWASQGWENGSLKYPVADEYTMYSANSKVKPTTSWGLFENGAILSSNDGAAVAMVADVTPDNFRIVVRRQFDQQLHQLPVNVGLHPQVDTVSVTDWSYGLWRSGDRKITFRLYGFHDNGLAPDTEFTAEIELGFDLVWPNEFAEPPVKTLVAGFYAVHVHASGPGNKEVATRLADGIHDAFYPKDPDPLTPYIRSGWKKVTDIPTGAQQDGSAIDVIGILVTQAGGLQILLNPLPAGIGNLRQMRAQAAIEDMVLGV